jgi:hypothetical protein
MNVSEILPLISQLLTLGLKIAEIIDNSEDVSAEDKEALKDIIRTAQKKVTPWNPGDSVPL